MEQLSLWDNEDVLKEQLSSIIRSTGEELEQFRNHVKNTQKSLIAIVEIQNQLRDIQSRLEEIEHLEQDVEQFYKTVQIKLDNEARDLQRHDA